jgi:uncharacterized protein with HEPN domain
MRDEYVQLALTHLVQIIGEAAGRLSDKVGKERFDRGPGRERDVRGIVADRHANHSHA